MMVVLNLVLVMVMMMVTQMHLLYPDAAAPPALHLAIHPSGFWLLVAAQNLLSECSTSLWLQKRKQ